MTPKVQLCPHIFTATQLQTSNMASKQETADLMFLDITVNCEDPRQDILKLMKNIKPEWKPDDIKYEVRLHQSTVYNSQILFCIISVLNRMCMYVSQTEMENM